MSETGLIDLELFGHQYTWERGRGTEIWTEVRLDRALITASWLNLFPLVKLYNVEGSTFNHSPILLIPEAKKEKGEKRKFRFENAWLTEPICRRLVLESWEVEDDIDIQTKIKL